ncbi:MAG: cysteine--tRNA ligase [Opitutaceae bacterium]|jgi:cysteinyl-tRNA synthetase
MALRLYDSLSRELRELKPSRPDGVFRFYNCGPTVYGPGHIGNFRTFIINDVLRRLLELEFGPDRVLHVRNITDVDDRTIAQSKAEGRPLVEITRKWTELFHGDCKALNCLPPSAEPSATGHIREQVDMIEVLMRKGNAYRAADGSVYFKIASFPAYGALSRIKERELKVTNSVFDADHKDDLGDFALWKAYKPEDDGDVKWAGPAGASEGRPGWHIECSAMSKKHLGDTIDLHTGGVDLLFPHHENEIAQSECCNGAVLSRHWYHSEHLLVDGRKMSKSLGNIYTLSDLAAKGFEPMAVRYALLSGHPRKQLNFTLDSLHAAGRALATLRSFRASLAGSTGGDGKAFAGVFAALEDDLNLPGALGALFTVVNRGARNIGSKSFDDALFPLGLRLDPPRPKADIPAAVSALAERRWAAKQAKDFAVADALRRDISAAGWSMLDRKDGYSLEPLGK